MTAQSLVQEIYNKEKIDRVSGYSLYEIVCSSELERPIRDEERVGNSNLAKLIE